MTLEVVSQPRITPEGKAQADSKAQHTRQYVSISRGLQRRHRGSDEVMKPLLRILDDHRIGGKTENHSEPPRGLPAGVVLNPGLLKCAAVRKKV
jgi:hypothetical protein